MIYSPNALTRSDILISFSEILVNAFCVLEPYVEAETPDSVFNFMIL